MSNTNKLTLIIPDIHHRWEQAEKIISSVGADEVIFLADYFDDFHDTAEMVKDTCEWLKESVKKSNRIHLIGNHDQHYMYPYRSFQCSGYEQWKYFITHDIVTRETWDKLKWYHFLDNKWLLTHAGLHGLNVPDTIKKHSDDRKKFIKLLSEHLDNSIIDGFKSAANNTPHWIFNAGRARSGHQRVGGITWCDYEREFLPVQGINQLMGHTPQRDIHWINKDEKGLLETPLLMEYSPTIKKLNNSAMSSNLCLDVHGNMHYAFWNGKKLTIGNYADL
jgi:hypothetical protein